jgi:hypothetical protein
MVVLACAFFAGDQDEVVHLPSDGIDGLFGDALTVVEEGEVGFEVAVSLDWAARFHQFF